MIDSFVKRRVWMRVLLLSLGMWLLISVIEHGFSRLGSDDWLASAHPLRSTAVLLMSLLLVTAFAFIHTTRAVLNGMQAVLIGLLVSFISLPPALVVQWRIGEPRSHLWTTVALAPIIVMCSWLTWKLVVPLVYEAPAASGR
jgi:predicted ABC-type sugar transport system permease subunit